MKRIFAGGTLDLERRWVVTFLQDLIGVNHSATFSFFLNGLQRTTKRKPSDQMFYVASVLAHYAQTPHRDDLEEVLNRAFFSEPVDPDILQDYGSRVILVAGFFRDQVRRRHSVELYDTLGQRFYYQAGLRIENPRKKNFFGGLAETLPWWTRSCCRLNRHLREEKYIFRVNQQ